MEGGILDRCHTIGDHDARNGRAARKGIRIDQGNAIRDHDTGKTCTIQKCTVTDGFQLASLRKGDGIKL